MSLTIEQKRTAVVVVRDMLLEAESVIAAEYKGLDVLAMTSLRREARASGVRVRVVKNSLARRAVEGTTFECLQKVFSGPLLLVFSGEDHGAGARLVRDFAKEHTQLIPTGIAIDGELRPAEDLHLIANMPSLDEARAQLLSVFKAPQTRLVRTLAEAAGQFVRLLSAYANSKEPNS